MAPITPNIGQKLWNFCHKLRHEGVDYGDYIEQLTYLLFLKMADEKSIQLPKMKLDDKVYVCNWPTLLEQSGTFLIDYYTALLRELSKQQGILGDIFTQAMPKLTNVVTFKQLLNEINQTEWTELDVDVKAVAFEDLLERAASEGKKGAGQYFTPRILIQSIVRCLKPDPRVSKDFKITDPACGTGGFLIDAYNWLMDETNGGADIPRENWKRIQKQTYHGADLGARPRRLALMNLHLHSLEGNIKLADSIYDPDDGERFDVVLTNPPFGTKGANQAPVRDDFTIETSSKQLNFVQHVMTILKPGGRVGIVLPDNVLFTAQSQEMFKLITKYHNLHTILRLPRGTFNPYCQGVRANVLFITKGIPTENIWIYDARTNIASVTKVSRPLSPEHFADFEACYGNDPNGRSERHENDRFKKFHITEIAEKNYNLDIRWLKEELETEFDENTDPEDIAREITDTLQEALKMFNEVLTELGVEESELTLVGV